ncbi:aldehyde dehydrogenase family protein [Citricoccus muralis]|uniref:Aldehyde dehydrogenase family protein n=1 Tax=Citricoccus muralis TaxID=169134 RepID=A0ABY8H7V1_9MICC|nr:aldehyde dehydrogenase family protein [Citricoccus muralis]WFP17228.1 aldehyde dehydrogenase family protein [Citricoccus muralis]
MTENQIVASVEDTVVKVAAASAVWAATPETERARVIRAVADALDAAADSLIPIAQEETNLPTPRLQSELKRTTFQLRLFAETVEKGEYLGVIIDHADPVWPMGAPRPDLRRMLVPIGPVLVFSASNFPFAFSVAGGDTAAALAAGNAVVVKAHPGHPKLSDATATVITGTAAEAGAPEGLLEVIHGQQEGVDALKHPAIKAASFTGSIPGGRALFDIANARPEPIPFYGELGSVNPAFVAPAIAAARPEEIAEGYLGSITGSQGQLCTKPGLLFVPEDSMVVEHLRAAPAPSPAPLLNDRIQESYIRELQRIQAAEGVEPIKSGDNSLNNPPQATVLFTRIDQVLADPKKLIAEVFGPAGVVVAYSDPAALTEVAKGLEGQLTSTIFAEAEKDSDLEIARNLLPILREKAGRLLWNQWPTGLSVTYAQQHGGPYPATTAPTTTAVGTTSIARFLRPVVFQNFPETLLPAQLHDSNPLGVPQQVN